MNKCKSCKSDRIASINGKTSDQCDFNYKDISHDGYVPSGIGLIEAYGDYIEFDYCLQCGTIQGEFPVNDNNINLA